MNLSSLWRVGAVVSSAVALPTLAAASTLVAANASQPVLIGSIAAGQSYTVTVSGIADLYAGYNGGAGLTFTADGKPTYAFPGAYASFGTAGLDYDPSVGPGSVGPGGSGRLMGSLLGTFSATPSSPANYFVIGLGTSFTAATAGALYAMVNDTYYGDNSASGYTVNLSAVPEAGSAWLLLAGLGVFATALRRRTTAA